MTYVLAPSKMFRSRYPNGEIALRSEERRAVVVLGFLALLFGYKSLLPASASFPFPLPYPVIHLQIYSVPFFDVIIGLWAIYEICMFVYFSEDWFPEPLREVFHGLGLGFLIAYPVAYVGLIAAVYLALFVPEYLALEYVILVVALLLTWIVGFFEMTVGRKRMIRSSIRFGSRLVVSLAYPLVARLKGLYRWARGQLHSSRSVSRLFPGRASPQGQFLLATPLLFPSL